MRRDEDNSSGCNLEIYNNNHRVISIPYQKNCVVMFFNNNLNNNLNNNSIKNKFEYSFTPRMTTIHSMRFLDIKI